MLDLLAAEWTAIFLTLRIAVIATLCALPFGIFAAFMLARRQLPGKTLVNGIVHLPLVLPPVVTAYLLLLSFGRRGMIAAFLADHFGIVFALLDPCGACLYHNGISADGVGEGSIFGIDRSALVR